MTSLHPEIDPVLRFLGERTGLSFNPTRADGAEQGVRRAMARAGVTDPGRYRELIERDAAALDDLIVELTVGETYFFREPAQFAYIRAEVLPDLRRRLGDGFMLRAWSAACASGEEAYTLAMLFEEEGVGERAYLLGTDVSRSALAKSRTAVYGAWSLRGEGAGFARAHLEKRDKHYVVPERLRRRVVFEYLNLALDVYPSFTTGAWGMNLILCRNVLIYFDPETIRATGRRLYESLAPGGWLFTSSSDPPLAQTARYETVATAAGVFYRRPAGSVVWRLPGPLPVACHGELAARATPLAEQPPPNDVWPPPVPALPAPPPAPITAPPPAPAVSAPPSALPHTDPDPLEEARKAFAEGEYSQAAEWTRDLVTEAAAVLRVRALANFDTVAAEAACAEAAERLPLSTELHYLRAVLLLGLHREDEAIRAVRRVLYLDRSLAVAHFTLGSILVGRGDPEGARRAYRNARDLAAARPADEIAPFSDGESAGRLAEAAAAQLAVLETAAETTP